MIIASLYIIYPMLGILLLNTKKNCQVFLPFTIYGWYDCDAYAYKNRAPARTHTLVQCVRVLFFYL